MVNRNHFNTSRISRNVKSLALRSKKKKIMLGIVFVFWWIAIITSQDVIFKQARPLFQNLIWKPPVNKTNEKCTSPVQNVYFLKTHKCASSTIQRVFLMYGVKHNMSFILPTKNNIIQFPCLFTFDEISIDTTRHYNFLVHHTIYNRAEMEIAIPRGPSTRYITIIREPATVYESNFLYVNIPGRANVTLKTLLTNLSFYAARVKDNYDMHFSWRNPILFDFGIFHQGQNYMNNYEHFLFHEDIAFIKKAIARIQTEFDLVMIVEYLDESLILLKDLLCWSIEDVAVVSLNVRMPYESELTPELAEKLRNWNQADHILYKYFLGQLHKRIEAYGRTKMRREVEQLKRIRRERMLLCMTMYKKGNLISYIIKDSAPEECLFLGWTESMFTNWLKEKQGFGIHKNRCNDAHR